MTSDPPNHQRPHPPQSSEAIPWQQSQGEAVVAGTSASQVPIPQRWWKDRIRGSSKFHDGNRPPASCCWVPPLVGWCPGLCETNLCCQALGEIGGYPEERSRCGCLHFGFVCNVLAFFLLMYACFAMSQNYTWLSNASMAVLTLTERDGRLAGQALLNIGLRAIALDNPFTGVDQVIVGFSAFCDVSQGGLQRYMNPENCGRCDEHSLNTCISILLAVISILPTFFTDILRMYSGYDVNCQKVFGTLLSICTVALILNVLFSWKFTCGDNFFKNEIYLDGQGNRVSFDDPNRVYTIDYDYTWGWGLMAMILAACFKFLQAMAHICVSTPSITRNLKEQQTYQVTREEHVQ